MATIPNLEASIIAALSLFQIPDAQDNISPEDIHGMGGGTATYGWRTPVGFVKIIRDQGNFGGAFFNALNRQALKEHLSARGITVARPIPTREARLAILLTEEVLGEIGITDRGIIDEIKGHPLIMEEVLPGRWGNWQEFGNPHFTHLAYEGGKAHARLHIAAEGFQAPYANEQNRLSLEGLKRLILEPYGMAGLNIGDVIAALEAEGDNAIKDVVTNTLKQVRSRADELMHSRPEDARTLHAFADAQLDEGILVKVLRTLEELFEYKQTHLATLPVRRAMCSFDFYPDNNMKNPTTGQVTASLDFQWMNHGLVTSDLRMAKGAYARNRNPDGYEYSPEKAAHYHLGYTALSPLGTEEGILDERFCKRYAALRFFATRAFDMLQLPREGQIEVRQALEMIELLDIMNDTNVDAEYQRTEELALSPDQQQHRYLADASFRFRQSDPFTDINQGAGNPQQQVLLSAYFNSLFAAHDMIDELPGAEQRLAAVARAVEVLPLTDAAERDIAKQIAFHAQVAKKSPSQARQGF